MHEAERMSTACYVDSDCDHETRTRNTIYALAAIYAIVMCATQFALIIDIFYHVVVFLKGSIFSMVLGALLLSQLVIARERGVMIIGPYSARMVIWVSVVAAFFVFYNILQIYSLLSHYEPVVAHTDLAALGVCAMTLEGVSLHQAYYLRT